MKRIVFICCTLCVFFLASCSNDIISSNNENDDIQAQIMEEDTSVIVVNSIEDLCKDLVMPKYEHPFLSTKANIITHTVTGYDELAYRYKDSKMIFRDKLAAILGVEANTVYIIDQYLLTKRVSMSGGYVIPLESPKCGFMPTGKNNEIGYSSAVIDGNLQMTTIITHVKYNILGQSINKWGPRQNAQVEWVYGTI